MMTTALSVRGYDDDSSPHSCSYHVIGDIVGQRVWSREDARTCRKPSALARDPAKLDNSANSIKVDVNPSTAHMFIAYPLKRSYQASLLSTNLSYR